MLAGLRSLSVVHRTRDQTGRRPHRSRPSGLGRRIRRAVCIGLAGRFARRIAGSLRSGIRTGIGSRIGSGVGSRIGSGVRSGVALGSRHALGLNPALQSEGSRRNGTTIVTPDPEDP